MHMRETGQDFTEFSFNGAITSNLGVSLKGKNFLPPRANSFL